jgi:hypothetical protein
MNFDYTDDDDVLPFNHYDPEQINDQEVVPMDYTLPPF